MNYNGIKFTIVFVFFMEFEFNPELDVTNDGKSFIFNKIDIGDGKKYRISINEMNPEVFTRMNAPRMIDFVQIFIHIRNSVGLTSDPPHLFNIKTLHDAIQYLHEEYVKRYQMPFTYGFDVFKTNNTRCNIMQLVRDKAIYCSVRVVKKPKLGENIIYTNYTVND